jgi:SAM-dependent methyltransferase
VYRNFEEAAVRYYAEKLRRHGPVPAGVDWNSLESQWVRFEQLLKVCGGEGEFSLIDFGCGYGALLGYLDSRDLHPLYWGFDLSGEMISEARRIHPETERRHFVERAADLPPADYTVASGIFNVRQDAPEAEWREYVVETLASLAQLSARGFAFNMLTSYSDPDKMRETLFYGDPCFFFHHCKTRFRSVALLHDYGLYEFTILVKK